MLLIFNFFSQAEKKQTAYDRKLISELVRGIIPGSWSGRYTVPTGCTVINWINDLALRIQQFITISETVHLNGAESLDVTIKNNQSPKCRNKLTFLTKILNFFRVSLFGWAG